MIQLPHHYSWKNAKHCFCFNALHRPHFLGFHLRLRRLHSIASDDQFVSDSTMTHRQLLRHINITCPLQTWQNFLDKSQLNLGLASSIVYFVETVIHQEYMMTFYKWLESMILCVEKKMTLYILGILALMIQKLKFFWTINILRCESCFQSTWFNSVVLRFEVTDFEFLGWSELWFSEFLEKIATFQRILIFPR